ncbi:MAG TPA: dihydrofolate reductase family protein [Candidatus Paceibacterota bacterium]|jgi:dihydrofolate reductase|nr:dihydrofolate reductase family protein [Candidatus Paceibacterota bacterium]
MKTFIIAAMTADGYIAKDAQHSPFNWTSKADKKRFIDITKKAGVIVVGSSTYKTFPGALKERLNIVYSRSQSFDGAETTQDEPAELLKKLEARGFKEVAICGGEAIYTMFMKAKVVDRLYLTVEPIIFGKGVKLFNDDMLFHLKLVSSAESSSGALLLEYAVDYSGNPKMS